MNILIPLIVLVLLGVLYAGSLHNPSQRLMVVLVVLSLIFIICYFNLKSTDGFMALPGYAPLDYTMGKCAGTRQPIDLAQKIGPAGSYDGLVLDWEWKTKPLVNDVVIFSDVGDAVKLTQDPASKNFPTVDGQPGSPKHLFMLAKNQVSWDCCPSPFGSDGMGGQGCVCLSKEQLNMFRTRGSNRGNPPDIYPGI